MNRLEFLIGETLSKHISLCLDLGILWFDDQEEEILFRKGVIKAMTAAWPCDPQRIAPIGCYPDNAYIEAE